MCNHHPVPAAMDAETKAIHERRVVIQALAAGATLTVSSAALGGCATNPETGEKQFIGLASAGQLNQMAAASWSEMKQKTPTSNDPRYTNRLKNIGSRISRGANRANQQWDYAVFDDDQKNAFVLPGNRVGFYKGMMDFAGNDDQIAAVMGHEVGHVSGRHARERVSQQMAGQLAIGAGTIIGGSQMSKRCDRYQDARQRAQCQQSASRNTALLSQALGLGFTFGVILPYSRKHESQSDLLGAKYMHKAGYDAHQSVKLWEKMAANSPSRQPEFMSTHPDPARRARDLHNYIRYQESLGSQGWESIQMPKSG
ncbi:M48 family metallopeptidase [Fretibacter rubidus]|uniref:M48 family metallopeptidase n=1 Tax=Fretibacter rubidus TaxID=570162 RepID=UPI00352AA087